MVEWSAEAVKVSELISKLEDAQRTYGDREVHIADRDGCSPVLDLLGVEPGRIVLTPQVLNLIPIRESVRRLVKLGISLAKREPTPLNW